MEFRSLAPKNVTGAYRGPVLCRLVGISYRQLDYWDRTRLLTPSITPAEGSGSQRLYSRDDVLLALTIRRLLTLGVSLQCIRDLIDPRFSGGLTGLREAIKLGRKRWNAEVIGGAGLWLNLGEIRRWLDEAESQQTEPAA